MGIFDQGVWLLSRFHAPFVTVMGRNLFGDHTSFILLLAVPALLGVAARPDPAGAPDLPAGRRRHPHLPAGLAAHAQRASSPPALAAAYLLNPALAERQPRAVPPGGVSGALRGPGHLRRRRVPSRCCWRCRWPRRLLVKEDTALLMIPLAAWVYFWRRNRTWGLRDHGARPSPGWSSPTTVVIDSLLGTMSLLRQPDPVRRPRRAGRPRRSPTRSGSGATSAATAGSFYLWQMGAAFGFGSSWSHPSWPPSAS